MIMRDLMEVEVIEADELGNLLHALDRRRRASLEDKMRVPEQRDALRALSLRWLRSQRALA